MNLSLWKCQLTSLLFILLMGLTNADDAMAQDWAGLNHFKEANAMLSDPSEGEHRIIFMGNSITIGWLSHYPEFFEGKPYVNRGIGGQTSSQMLLRFRQDVIDLQASVVVILAGTNDIAGNTGPMTLEQIQGNIHSMVQLAKAHEIIPIVCSVLPAYDYPWRPGLSPNIKIPKLNEMLKTMCVEEKVFYLDYFSKMADNRNGLPKEYTTDEVHLTPKGYRIMEKLVTDAITQVLHE